jgi:predicted O-linked N-acetylglucosamine transferase (SPINDLY family)
LELYSQVDVALDTFPYNGMTTTCDALWMGVPVVTLAGEPGRPESRTGLALLSAAGLAGSEGWAADTLGRFVEIAAALSGDLPRLAAIRAELRKRAAASPLGDANRVARALEAAYRDLWRRWCRGGG